MTRRLIDPFRPLIHWMRGKMLQMLGVSKYELLPVDERFNRLMDRVMLVESHVNWRLLGLPSPGASVALETASTLGSAISLPELLARCLHATDTRDEEAVFADTLKRLKDAPRRGLVLASKASLNFRDQLAEFIVVNDTDDPLSTTLTDMLPVELRTVRTHPLAALALARQGELGLVWLSDYPVRSHPLRTLALLASAATKLSHEGIIVARIKAAPSDFRHLRDFSVQNISGIVPSLECQDQGNGWAVFRKRKA